MLSAVFASLALLSAVKADYQYSDVANAFSGYSLVFQDDFDGSSLNPAYWTPDWDCTGWGNDARMCYTTNPKNLYVKDSMLNIQPICGRLQPNKSICTPYSGYPQCCCEPTNDDKMDSTSAQVTTRHKVTFNQGKVRVRAKLSTGYYTWPAMWLYQDWTGSKIPPASEIDIMEGVGKMPDWWSAVIHYPVTKDGVITDKTKYKNDNTGMMFNESFHVFGVDWSDNEFVWTVDEKPMWTYQWPRLNNEEGARAPYNDGGFHILLDVAVGGRMFGIGYGKNKPSYEELCADGPSWTATQFDWVRVYQQTGKRNITMNGPGPQLVPGSNGATCLFDGCVGSNWAQEVADFNKTTATVTTGAVKPTGVPSSATFGKVGALVAVLVALVL